MVVPALRVSSFGFRVSGGSGFKVQGSWIGVSGGGGPGRERWDGHLDLVLRGTSPTAGP
jgi:hypothetical protein